MPLQTNDYPGCNGSSPTPLKNTKAENLSSNHLSLSCLTDLQTESLHHSDIAAANSRLSQPGFLRVCLGFYYANHANSIMTSVQQIVKILVFVLCRH